MRPLKVDYRVTKPDPEIVGVPEPEEWYVEVRDPDKYPNISTVAHLPTGIVFLLAFDKEGPSQSVFETPIGLMEENLRIKLLEAREEPVYQPEIASEDRIAKLGRLAVLAYWVDVFRYCITPDGRLVDLCLLEAERKLLRRNKRRQQKEIV